MKISLLLIAFFGYFSLTANAQYADTAIVQSHLRNIIETEKPRNFENLEVLNYVVDYIHDELAKYAHTTYYQPYNADIYKYKNVIGGFGKENSEPIVVGAYHDVCNDQDGADDKLSHHYSIG